MAQFKVRGNGHGRCAMCNGVWVCGVTVTGHLCLGREFEILNFDQNILINKVWSDRNLLIKIKYHLKRNIQKA